jgi:hypothetical protein
MNNRPHELTDTPNETPLSIRSGSSATGFRSEDSCTDPPNLRVLVVEDNAVNRRLLGAFLKKYGSSNVQYAENGALAVKVVEECLEGFDVIFMGAFLTKYSHYPSFALTFLLSYIPFMYRYPDKGYILLKLTLTYIQIFRCLLWTALQLRA